MQAIVLAGNRAPEELQTQGISHVFMLRIGGETLLERICRCLIEGGGCNRVLIRTGEDIAIPEIPEVDRFEPRGHVIEDVFAACREQLDSERVFLSAADIPLITPVSVEALKDYSHACGADFVYPIVSESEMQSKYPGTSRTYLPFSGTRFTGGNVMVFKREWMLGREDLVDYMFRNRKNPIALVSRIGFLFALKVALRVATLEDAQQSVSRLSDGNVIAAKLQFPEIALDLDKQSDLEFFREFLDDYPGSA